MYAVLMNMSTGVHFLLLKSSVTNSDMVKINWVFSFELLIPASKTLDSLTAGNIIVLSSEFKCCNFCICGILHFLQTLCNLK